MYQVRQWAWRGAVGAGGGGEGFGGRGEAGALIVVPGGGRGGCVVWGEGVFFAISALIGLALTGGVVALATQLGASPLLAKIFAVGTSFTAVYAIRKWGIFR